MGTAATKDQKHKQAKPFQDQQHKNKKQSNKLEKALRISNIPTGLPQEYINYIFDPKISIEKIIKGENSQIIIFKDYKADDLIWDTKGYDVHEITYQEQTYSLILTKADSLNIEDNGKNVQNNIIQQFIKKEEQKKNAMNFISNPFENNQKLQKIAKHIKKNKQNFVEKENRVQNFIGKRKILFQEKELQKDKLMSRLQVLQKEEQGVYVKQIKENEKVPKNLKNDQNYGFCMNCLVKTKGKLRIEKDYKRYKCQKVTCQHHYGLISQCKCFEEKQVWKECPICLTNFDHKEHQPYVLSCGHNVCQIYIKGRYIQNQIECPLCRKRHKYLKLEDIPKNFMVISALLQI